MARLSLFAMLVLSAISAGAAEHVLPVFALNVEGVGGSLWNSEVMVTNRGPVAIVVHERSLIGWTSGGVPCLPIVQPFLTVEPHSTKVWSSGELALGLGCPESAAGALSFFSESDVVIRSRIVNTHDSEVPVGPLRGFGQEVDAVDVASLPNGTLMLPGVSWHPNACGPTAFDTNVFFANPGQVAVRVSIDLEEGTGDFLVVDGEAQPTPFELTIGPGVFRQLRISGSDTPLAVCLPPIVASFLLETDGKLTIVASVVDRSTGDARTVAPIAAQP
ncbi:MAG: hypothetical protein HYU52_18450 [Acidobacteria bacterium]|nr:hypothetical protein [Acidobacteriota bacterium]